MKDNILYLATKEGPKSLLRGVQRDGTMVLPSGKTIKFKSLLPKAKN